MAEGSPWPVGGDGAAVAGDCSGLELPAGCDGAPADEEGTPGVGLCTPVAPVGFGAVTPGGTPGAYDMDGPLELPAGCGGAAAEEEPLGAVLGSPAGAEGVGAGGAADCPGPELPAGCEGAATQGGVPCGVDAAPPAPSENDSAAESTSANVPLCSLKTTWFSETAMTTASPIRSPTPTT